MLTMRKRDIFLPRIELEVRPEPEGVHAEAFFAEVVYAENHAQLIVALDQYNLFRVIDADAVSFIAAQVFLDDSDLVLLRLV